MVDKIITNTVDFALKRIFNDRLYLEEKKILRLSLSFKSKQVNQDLKKKKTKLLTNDLVQKSSDSDRIILSNINVKKRLFLQMIEKKAERCGKKNCQKKRRIDFDYHHKHNNSIKSPISNAISNNDTTTHHFIADVNEQEMLIDFDDTKSKYWEENIVSVGMKGYADVHELYNSIKCFQKLEKIAYAFSLVNKNNSDAVKEFNYKHKLRKIFYVADLQGTRIYFNYAEMDSLRLILFPPFGLVSSRDIMFILKTFIKIECSTLRFQYRNLTKLCRLFLEYSSVLLKSELKIRNFNLLSTDIV